MSLAIQNVWVLMGCRFLSLSLLKRGLERFFKVFRGIIMPLDFHRLDTHEHLYTLSTQEYNDLQADIFTTFKHWTGIDIDEYGDSQLTFENQQTLIRIIDEYIEKTDLNRDKNKTKNILAFRGILLYIVGNHWDLQLLGD